MGLNHFGRLLVPVALALSVALAAPVVAGLGGNVDSVRSDSTVFRGQLRSTPLLQYDVQEITHGELIVREYTSRAGQVFAVTWQGPTPPNLRQLLGTYFGRFQSAAAASHQSNPGIHRRLSLSQSDLVVESTGRLRAFRGLAYLPSLLPAGVSANELQ